MLPRIYALVWLAAIAAAGFLYVSGRLNELTLTIAGFILGTLFFGFFVAVLPWWVDKIHAPRYLV